MTTTLLLIDDDPMWCASMKLILIRNGFQVEVANNALSGLQKAYSSSPDVILLDLMMPGMDGWEVCSRFREIADTPIIMVTALDSQENMVRGLNLGADDYINKTVSPSELMARIRAVLRRISQPEENRFSPQGNAIFSHNDLVVDFRKREVMVTGERIDLSPTEFRLLAVLVRYNGRVLPHDFLLKEVWGPEHVGETRSLRLYIGYLRRKVEKDPKNPTMIHTEWGIGYRFG